MKYVITIETENDAFANGKEAEVVVILRQIIGRYDMGHDLCGSLCDYNGNHCGTVILAESD